MESVCQRELGWVFSLILTGSVTLDNVFNFPNRNPLGLGGIHVLHLEKEMAAHSSILAWRIPGTVEPDGLPSKGWHRVGNDWSDLAAAACTAWIPGIYQIPLHPSTHSSSCLWPLEPFHSSWFDSLKIITHFIHSHTVVITNIIYVKQFPWFLILNKFITNMIYDETNAPFSLGILRSCRGPAQGHPSDERTCWL